MRDKVEHMGEEVNAASRRCDKFRAELLTLGHIRSDSQKGKLVSYCETTQPLLTYTARPMSAKLFQIAIPFAGTLLGLASPCAAQTIKANGYSAYSVAAKDPQPPHGPTFAAVLLGGHGDVDEATSFLCRHSGGGELVVLRASGADDYNSEFQSACPGNSVVTLVITSREGANDPFVAEKIRNAQAIFIAGGDQSNYVKYWTGNAVQKEINEDVKRGVPIGGISAGLAVQGEFVFDSMLDTVKSPEALANPYDPHVTLVRDFLSIPVLKSIITDSHFSQRQRMGRSLAFLARIVQDGWAQEAHGIGLDETTAVLVEADGHARVVGKNSAYFITLDHRPEVCVDGKPLTLSHVSVLKLSAGDTFDLRTWSASGGRRFEANVVDGKMTTSEQP
jgi:cyanophycinase